MENLKGFGRAPQGKLRLCVCSFLALFWLLNGGKKATVACPLTSTGSLSSGHRVSPKQAGPDRTSISPSKALETAGTFSQMGFRRIHSHSRCYNTVAACGCSGLYVQQMAGPSIVSQQLFLRIVTL